MPKCTVCVPLTASSKHGTKTDLKDMNDRRDNESLHRTSCDAADDTDADHSCN